VAGEVERAAAVEHNADAALVVAQLPEVVRDIVGGDRGPSVVADHPGDRQGAGRGEGQRVAVALQIDAGGEGLAIANLRELASRASVNGAGADRA
jgi:hypothetical protein